MTSAILFLNTKIISRTTTVRTEKVMASAMKLLTSLSLNA